MKFLLLIAAPLLIACEYVLGDILLPRYSQYCGYAGGRIYCYGGDTNPDRDYVKTDSVLYSLNIAQYVGQTTDSLSNKWETVIPSTPFDAEERQYPNAIVTPDGKQIFIFSGRLTGARRLVNQTIIYDTTNNSWRSVSQYDETNRGTRQIYHAAVTSLSNGLISFYGGLEQNANTSIPWVSTSGVAMPFDGNTSHVGFNNIKVYSLEGKKWSIFNPQFDAPDNFYPNSQIAILHPASKKIYYIGGSFFTPTSNATKVNFSWAHVFNTDSGIWTNQTLGGDFPTRREYHSAHLLPNSPDIILYGGTMDYETASRDYCFTLNLDNNIWTSQYNRLDIPTSLSGPRFSHSSVLVNTTLFILFGKNLGGILSPSIVTIDVANVSNIFYTATLNLNSTEAAPEVKTNTDPSSPGLSKGAIGGIAAGAAAVGVLVIIAVILYCVRSKRKGKKYKANDPNEHATEQISVDWDKIDNQYKEVPVAGQNVVVSPHSTDSMDATKVGDTSPEITTASHFQKSPLFSDSYLTKEQTYRQEHDQFGFTGHNAENSHVVNPSINPGTTKPSIDSKDVYPAVVKPDAA